MVGDAMQVAVDYVVFRNRDSVRDGMFMCSICQKDMGRKGYDYFPTVRERTWCRLCVWKHGFYLSSSGENGMYVECDFCFWANGVLVVSSVLEVKL
jgi:hypothetical protein